MSQKQNNQPAAFHSQRHGKAAKIAVYAVVLAAVLALGFVIGGAFSHAPGTGKTRIAGDVTRYAEDQDYSAIEESASIAIPGYETLSFMAGQKTQEVTLYNPAENTCYFRMSLVLEDGMTLWTSDLLEPGMAFTRLDLKKSLKAGVYPATIHYDCYSLKDQTPLNGAEINVTLEVG